MVDHTLAQLPNATSSQSAGVSPDASSRVDSSIRRVLLATDLSPASEAATTEAIALALRHGASLVVLSVVDPRRLRLAGGPFLRRADQEYAELLAGVQQVVARARLAAVSATFLVWEGEPADTIMAASESEGADTIVMGSHGRGRIGRLLLGSTSARVSESASCRVIVVPS